MLKIYVLQRCLCCGTPFIKKHRRHVFCRRQCFKKIYREKSKEISYPEFICPSCGKISQLDFDPLELDKWRDFKCKCGFKPCKAQPFFIDD